MTKLNLSIIVFALVMGSLPARPCSCRKALEGDQPHGANLDIEYSERTVKRIEGRVVYESDSNPVDDVVVEIYQVNPEDVKLRPREIAQRRERWTACVTVKNGHFCFPDLPSGKYVVRAGVRNANAGMNDVYWKVRLDRRWWTRWFRRSREMELRLTAGT